MAARPHSSVSNHIRTITVTSEDGRQVLDRRAYEELADLLDDAAGDPETRVVVLRGLSGCFCLGGDFSEFLDASRHPGLIAAVTALFRGLATFPKPILALVDGEAVGVGCTILFHCDMVVASPRSTFRVPFVDFGLVPDAATSILAPEKLGYAGAFRFFCLGETLGAADALRMGLLAETVPAEEIEDRVYMLARRLTKKPVQALLQTRGLLRGDGKALCERVDREINLFREALADETTLRRLKKIAQMAA
jgi:enoyl-CoA hydratase/carnithine racemase